jgi:hypothetical protein
MAEVVFIVDVPEAVESIPAYIRVSGNIKDSSAAITNVYTFALKTYDPVFAYDLAAFAERNLDNLIPMFDPLTGSTSKAFDNPSGIEFPVIAYVGKAFDAQTSVSPTINEVVPGNSYDVFAYSINSLGYKKITHLTNP